MKAKIQSLFFFLFALALVQHSMGHAQVIINDVKISGHKRIPEETIRFYIQSRSGQPLDAGLLQRDFRSLLKLGAFENIDIERIDSENGATLVFKLQERPFISAVDYQGVPPPMVTRIVDRLQEKKLDVRANAPYDPAKIRQAEETIRALLEQEGHTAPEVHCRKEESTPSTVKLTFNIDKRSRVKVEAINFTGNRAFSNRKLRGQMRLTKEMNLFSALARKDTYSKARVEDDIRRIVLFYQEHGYAKVQVGEPVVAPGEAGLSKLPDAEKLLKLSKRLKIKIPIVEGEVYSIGDVKLTGEPTGYDEEFQSILSRFQPGEIYNIKKLQTAYEDIKKVLGAHGYLSLNPTLSQDFDEAHKTVKVTFNLEQVYPFYVHRVEFLGNKRLPDKLLRRQLLVNEGDPFNERLLDRSLVKLNRSGFVREVDRKDVDVKVDKENREVDVIVSLKEKGRQGFWFTGGTAGIGGGYTGLIYSAINIFGLGEILGLESTGGPRNSNIVLDMLMPNLLGTKASLGFSIFRRYFDFDVPGLGTDPMFLLSKITKRSFGASLSGSYPLSEVSRLDLSFQVENINGNHMLPSLLPVQGLARRAVTPAWRYDTTDHYLNPHKGQVVTVATAFAGGFLGGEVNVIRPTFEYKYFTPDPLSHGRNTLAFRGLLSHARGFHGQDVPLYERFFSDGYFVRGFNVGEMSPLAFYRVPGASPGLAATAIGGDTIAVFNAEYRVPINDLVSLNYFFDAGITSVLRDPKNLLRGQKLSLIQSTNSLLRASTGGELRVQLPMINQPLRLVFAINPLRLNKSFIAPDGNLLRLKERRSRLRFALGNSF